MFRDDFGEGEHGLNAIVLFHTHTRKAALRGRLRLFAGFCKPFSLVCGGGWSEEVSPKKSEASFTGHWYSQNMNNSENISELLRQSIAASDRTTRAVRALVRFIFIQLSTTTLGAAFVYFGMASVDPTRCYAIGDNCEPNYFLLFLGVVVWLGGIVASSNAGWSELSKSDPGKSDEDILSAGEPQPLDADVKTNDSDANKTQKSEFKKCKACGKVVKRDIERCTNCYWDMFTPTTVEQD
jgi:hypothetical protein